MTTKANVTAAVLANATQLAVEAMMRMPRTSMSGAVGGNFLTRTSAASLAMNIIRKKAVEQAAPAA